MKNESPVANITDETAAPTLKKNIETILQLEKEGLEKLSPIEHLADKITAIAGSTPFLLFHVAWFTCWILINTNMVPHIHSFDPYPFSFLTLVVSLEAIFLTLLVLMSQNSMTRTADKRAHLDLQINMLDEQETTMILRMVQKIVNHLGLQDEMSDSIDELSTETDLAKVAKAIDEGNDRGKQ